MTKPLLKEAYEVLERYAIEHVYGFYATDICKCCDNCIQPNGVGHQYNCIIERIGNELPEVVAKRQTYVPRR